MNLEVVHQTLEPVEANAVKEQLEAAGIPCSMINETSSSMLPTPDTAIRLMVPEERVEEAKTLIEDFLRVVDETGE